MPSLNLGNLPSRPEGQDPEASNDKLTPADQKEEEQDFSLGMTGAETVIRNTGGTGGDETIE
jgi:hypothetical protein